MLTRKILVVILLAWVLVVVFIPISALAVVAVIVATIPVSSFWFPLLYVLIVVGLFVWWTVFLFRSATRLRC